MRERLAGAVALLLLVASASPAGESLSSGRFVPDEIIVKLRTPTSEAGGVPQDLSDDKVLSLRDLPLLRDRVRVREIKPILAATQRRPGTLRSPGGRGLSRLAETPNRLATRRNRATEAGGRLDLSRVYRVRVDLGSGVSLPQVLAAYRSRPDVEFAELNPILSVCLNPNDRVYPDQWALGKIRVADAWDTCRGSSDVLVAVIDTGVDYNHPDLQGNLWTNDAERDGLPGVDDDGNGRVDDIRGYNFIYNTPDPIDDHGHGTACAGVIAAVGNNSTDIAGVCWTAQIMPVKILGATGDGTAADAVPAIHYAVANGADIISGSWGGAEDSSLLRDAIAYAHAEGVIVVAAAGNMGSDTPYYPAAYPNVISVAATDWNDRRWNLSNYGDWVDLAAPGQDIVSLLATLPGRPTLPGYVSRLSGTSLATPHVSGTCALLLAANPLLRYEELQRILTTTADPIQPGICSSNGRLNVSKALRAVIPLAGTIRMERGAYAEGADIGLLLADWHLRGAGHQTVVIEAAGGDLETVALRESNVSLGVFRGAISTENAVTGPGDGILQVRDGEGIQVRYLDGDDGLGAMDQWRFAAAVADYEPPAVVGVEIMPQGPTTAVDVRTSEPTHVEIRYSRTLGGPYDLAAHNAGFHERQTVTLSGLARQTNYYFIVVVADEAGNEAVADNEGQGYSFFAQRGATQK
ncbi:MAG: S8 family serine peptidase [Planctomycetes bacterium]|jgi:hypothetical protein|nr:S8 family serine peptidase [Planctomycetota bacterium]